MGHTEVTGSTSVQQCQVNCAYGLAFLYLGNGNLAVGRLAHAGQRLDQLGLTIAFDARNAENFTGTYLQIDIMQDLQATIGIGVQVFDV